MAKSSSPKVYGPKTYGQGRIQFLADLSGIRSELARGFTLKAVYQPRHQKLGITYASFAKLVARYAADARPIPLNKKATDERQSSLSLGNKSEKDHTGRADPALLRRLIKGQ